MQLAGRECSAGHAHNFLFSLDTFCYSVGIKFTEVFYIYPMLEFWLLNVHSFVRLFYKFVAVVVVLLAFLRYKYRIASGLFILSIIIR